MSSKYTPVHRRVQTAVADAASHAIGNLAHLRAVRMTAPHTGIPADFISCGLLLLSGSALLYNPFGIAAIISDSVAMPPACSAMRNMGSQSMKKLDYWLIIGTAFTIESVIGNALIGRLVPTWWLAKFVFAVMAMADKPAARKALTSELRGESVAALPDREPSPSPVQAMMTALSPSSADPYNTADMIRDNNGPYHVISPTGPQHGPLASQGPVGRNREPINTHKVRRKSVVLSPTRVLDEMLDKSAPGQVKEVVQDVQPRQTFSVDDLLDERIDA